MNDILDLIMKFENGNMQDDSEIIDFFQKLIDSGLAWQLQGAYGRQAKYLIDQGFCTLAKKN